MKVALVTSLPHGGPVTHAVLLAGELVRAGVDVTAVVAHEGAAAAFTATGAETVLATGHRRASMVQRACRAADVVHTHDRRSALWVLGRSRPPGRVRVHTLHGLPEPYLAIPDQPGPTLRDRIAYQIVEPRLLGRAHCVIVPSEATRRAASGLGHPVASYVMIPNGVAPTAPLPPVATSPTLPPCVGTVAALETVKGVDVFLRAAARLQERRPTLRFVVAGDGPEGAHLRRLATALGLSESVRFTGHVPVASVLPGLSVVVVSSYFETSSFVALEAMAAGRPLVATRCGGLPEAVPAEAVTLVAPGDPAALADAVDGLLDDPREAGIRADAARAHVVAHRTAAGTAAAVLDTYRHALAGAGR